jgi:hypothetical protein
MTLRALTLIQPMASAIVADDPRRKTIENRPRSLPKTMLGKKTVIAVHAGLKWNEDYAALAMRILGSAVDWDRAANLGGHILGLAEFTGRQFVADDAAKTIPRDHPGILWFSGPYGYAIGDAVALPEPVACRGALGWWPVPEEVTASIFAQAPAWRSRIASSSPLTSTQGV